MVLIAQSLANYLENKQWREPTRVLLDTLVVEESGIEAVRELRQFLWKKPLVSSRRSAIVGRAEALTPEAQHALLKITEEPPAHGFVMLLVRDPDMLLPTLVSRFQKMYVPATTAEKSVPPAVRRAAVQFIKDDPRRRREIIRTILGRAADETDSSADFVTALMIELDRQPVRHWRALKELSHRWRLINQFNVNRRLQLTAVAAALENHDYE